MLSTLLFAFCCPAPLATPFPGLDEGPVEGLLLESRLLATLPEGMSLDFPEQSFGGASYQRPHCLAWSPNGRRVAYIGVLDGAEHPVIGDEVLDEYDYTAGPEFSANSARVLFRVGNRVTKTREKWWLLVDGEEVFDEDWIGTPALSADGDELAVWIQPGAKVQKDGSYNNNSQVFLLLEDSGRSWKKRTGKKSAHAISLTRPIFVGGRAFTVGGNGAEWEPVPVISHERGEQKPEVLGELAGLPNWFAVDHTGEHWGATVMTSDAQQGTWEMRSAIVLDGEVLEREGDAVHGPYYSGMDERVAMRLQVDGEFVVKLVGSQRKPSFEYAFAPVFGAKGGLAFVATEGATVDVENAMTSEQQGVVGGKRYVVRRSDGEPEDLTGALWLEVRNLVFSPDGARLAYAARSAAGWQVVVEEVAGAVFDEVGTPRFSEDSASVAHGARDGSELWWRVWKPAEGAAE